MVLFLCGISFVWFNFQFQSVFFSFSMVARGIQAEKKKV
jgi:hypothetical protein